MTNAALVEKVRDAYSRRQDEWSAVKWAMELAKRSNDTSQMTALARVVALCKRREVGAYQLLRLAETNCNTPDSPDWEQEIDDVVLPGSVRIPPTR